MELTAHIPSAQCAYNAAVAATERSQAITTAATSLDDAAGNWVVASEDTSMSSIEDVDVSEVDFSVEPMDVDANLSVTNEEIISTGT